MLPIGIRPRRGLLSDLLGIAGPLMVLLLHLDQKTAQGTSLAVLLPPTGLFAFLEYYLIAIRVWFE